MPTHEDYVSTFRRICEQAHRSSYDLGLAKSTPTATEGDSFVVSFNVGGIVTLLVDPKLYEELRDELEPHMRKILRDLPAGNRRKIEFYPVGA